MSNKFIAGFIFLIIVLLGGAYLLLEGSNKGSKPIATYSANTKERPQVKIEKTSSDLGKIKVADIKEKDFIVKNTGNKDLQLYNISSSCNCTTGQIIYQGKAGKEYGMHKQSEEIISVAPQTEVKIRVIYRPYLMPVYGTVEREVYISTNDPKNPKLIFKIKAFVQ